MGLAAGVGLDPVREALLAQTRAEAEGLVSQARARAAAQVAQAEEEAGALIARARAEGEAAAELQAAAELADARRRARTLVLEAKRDVYEDLRREAQAAAQRLRGEPGYEELVGRLAILVRERLGPDFEVELDPPGGGIVARAGNRRLDCSLPALVERCLAQHAVELERLWS
jgi:vacuolar-type H+-ATPase subunit E/Vma4